MKIYQKDPRSGQWVPFGKTSVVQDNLNPKFVDQFKTTYHFEQIQQFRFARHDS